MPGPWIRGLLSASLLLFAAACSGDVPATASAPDDALAARQTGVKLVVSSGGGQVGVPGHALAEPVVVRVLDRRGVPIAGARVNFLASAEGIADPRQTNTDADGYARTTWTLLAPGAQTLRASGVGGTVLVAATAQPGSGATHALVKTAGDGQHGPAGARLPGYLEVRLVRDDGKPVPGAQVAWTVATGGGSVSHGTVKTLPTGHARVRWTLGMEPGEQTLVASAAGAGPVTFTAKAPGNTAPKPVSLHLTPDSLVLDVGQTGQFNAVVRDKDGAELPGHTPAWSSSDAAVATVTADGTVHALAPGATTVTAKVGALQAQASMRVRPVAVQVPLIQKRVSAYGGTIDVSTRGVTLNFWVHLAAPATTIGLRVRDPAGGTADCTNVQPENDWYVEFRCQVGIAQGSRPGVWRADRVTITRNGQTHVVTGAELDAMGTKGRAFDVHGTGPDASPPQVRTVWPHGRDSYDAGFYWMKVGVIDHVSGVQGVQVTLRGPGGQMVSCNAHSSGGALAKVADWYCKLPIPAGSGRWHLVSVATVDGAGNTATWTPAEIDKAVRGVWELTFLQYAFDP
jgi:hypothetical protein